MVIFREKSTHETKNTALTCLLYKILCLTKKCQKSICWKEIFPIYGGVQKYRFGSIRCFFFVSGLPTNRKKSPVRWSWGDHSDGLIHRLIEVRVSHDEDANGMGAFLKELRFNQMFDLEKTYMQFFWFHVGRRSNEILDIYCTYHFDALGKYQKRIRLLVAFTIFDIFMSSEIQLKSCASTMMPCSKQPTPGLPNGRRASSLRHLREAGWKL